MIRVDETDPVGEIEPSFPYRDVTVRRGVEFKDLYEIQSEIGRGKFGTVYRCKEKNTGLSLAAKVVNTARKEDRRSVEREVEIMRRLQHPRLIQLYDAIDTGKHIHVILELIEGGELFERVIGDDFVLTERSCAVFMRQICEGIEFVHAQNILHLDMKPENILCLTKEGNRIKIIDFGLARQYDPEKKLQVLFGTPEFVAPEVVNFDQIGYGTDMWSIGVICYVLLSGLSPFMGDTDIETMANVTIAKYDFDDEAFTEISEDAKDFIRGLLVKDIKGRTSASRCRQQAWLARKSPALPKVTAKPHVERPSVEFNAGTKEELDVTKDNLRLFVERWREHPDSPYLIELDAPPRWDSVDSGNPEPRDALAFNEIDNESISLRGQSPSPCGSICSAVSSEPPSSPRVNNPFHLSVPGSGFASGLGFPFERRASEGTGAGAGREKPRDPAAQIVLAEEIIKLSEHLRSMALAPRVGAIGGSSSVTASPSDIPSCNDRLADAGGTGKTEARSNYICAKEEPLSVATNGAKDSQDDEGSTGSERVSGDFQTNGTRMKKSESNGNARKTTGSRGDESKRNGSVSVQTGSSDTNEIEKKLSILVEQRKQKGTTFNGVSKYDRKTETSSTFDVSSFGSRKTSASQANTHRGDSGRRDSSTRFDQTDSSQQSSAEDFGSARNSNSLKASTFLLKSSSTRRSGSFSEADEPSLTFLDKRVDLTPPWRRGRGKSKHRFSETCRDVPRISNLHDLHQNLNLDEPTSTKDLLLHLLGEWDDVTRPNGIGRKSISVDWCGEESIGRRSMSSLAEYFQSEREKPAPGVPPASQPSIHR